MSQLNKTISEIEKNEASTSKLNAHTVFLNKKSKWFEFTLVLAVIGITVTLTKLYL